MTGATTRGPIAIICTRTFGPFFFGKLMSSFGIWIQNIAAAVLMFELTRSAFWVGTVSILQFAGPLIFAMWAGALTDLFDRRKLMMAGRLLSGAAVATLSILLAVRGIDGFGGPVTLLTSVFVMGLGLALSSPAMQALVPALVEPEDLEQALALSSAAPSIARAVGPALGAGLLAVSGPALAFGVAATGHIGFVAVMLLVRPRPYRRPQVRPPILGGIRYLLNDRKAGRLVLGIALISFGADPLVTLTPSLADELGGGSETVGLLVSAFGAGAVLLSLLFNHVRRITNLRIAGIAGACLLAGGLATVALSGSLVSAGVGFAASGMGFLMANVALNSRIQRRVPEELRGRVMAMWSVAFLGARPFAALLNGSIADLVSTQAAMAVTAVIVLSSAFVIRVSYGSDQAPDDPYSPDPPLPSDGDHP